MNKSGRLLRKLVVALIGFPLFVLGLILIPLPGPGLIVSFIALFILSFEFDWADKYKEKAKAEFKKIYANAKERADRIENLGSDKKR